MLRLALTLGLALCALPAWAFSFTALDGSPLNLADWRGQPVLVVNTASLCGFTRQYGDMQQLYEDYGPRGLVVLAVPSDDFRQELSSNEEVADFCRVQTGLTFPITQITPVRGGQAHPFYQWLAEAHGHVQNWNFNKALIGPDGALLGFWGSAMRPTARAITREIRAALP
ncbi:glutathione peroxidase [Roseinatronobacter thiooxidans]|uniref:Glutathione peroxidase n=1 Tax=Roseinatronobacter thiooxidans TaxID=121821 RepID=A0A2W7Q1R1_9RHOB|nr:glutathione peroxidase [Roseinatronobacter thiooxidans]PZX42231.1 glutathione peroxidase [Roseinatronobacter thiooxidans]